MDWEWKLLLTAWVAGALGFILSRVFDKRKRRDYSKDPVNLDWWESLTPEQRAQIEEIIKQAGRV